MIPHSLHNKEYFGSYDEKYDIFSLFFSSFNCKYLKLIKIDIPVFEFKLFMIHQQYIYVFDVVLNCVLIEHYYLLS